MAETLWDHQHPGIFIDGTETFFKAASAALNTLRSRPLGKDLLSLLSKRTQIVKVKVIVKLAPGTLAESAGKTAASPHGYDALKSGKTLPGTEIQLAGKGAGSTAAFNPDAEAEYTALVGIATPPYVALAHELIHSLHHLSGNVRTGVKAGAAKSEQAAGFRSLYLHEEAHTVGLGIYAKTRLSENAIRKEWNLTQRTYYSKPNDCDALPALPGGGSG